MPDIDVKSYLGQLKAVLPIVQPIPTGPLKALHAAGDYKGMIQIIKKAMNIEEDVTFVVHLGAGRCSKARPATECAGVDRVAEIAG